MESHSRSDDEMPSSPPAAAGFLSPKSFSTRSPSRLPSRLPSRSPSRSPPRTKRMKEKRVPSVTPRRLRTFFTPRTRLSTSSRMTLGAMDSASVNRLAPRPLSPPPSSDPMEPPSSPTERLQAVEEASRKKRRVQSPGPGTKRRRTTLSDDESQLVTHENIANERRTLFFKASRKGVHGSGGKSLESSRPLLTATTEVTTAQDYQPQPIRKLRNRGFEACLLDREHGFSVQAGKQHLAFPAADARIETAAFHSDSSDAYHCTPLGDQVGTSIPFSLASCHGAPVTAIGDERGDVRFLSTAGGAGHQVQSWVKVHDNAIMDLAFSADDARLASACGDRSGRVLDTQTQTVAVELNDHWDSLRQVTFQPGGGNGNVLASSDRAGRVQVWDLRCSSLPAQCFSSATEGLVRDRGLEVAKARTVNTMDGAHERTTHGNTSSSSVTALQWLPAGREHLLLTGSEANATVKLWDTRYIKPRRHRQAAERPVASTPEPATHAWRSYGITSMTLGSDAARLYVVCKDSTVYAYSTNHLVLGHAPELADGAGKRRPMGSQGLGPLYGLRNDALRVGSFYVKCAVRPSGRGGGMDELLAVGSSDGCAVLFPTDERYLRTAWARREHMTMTTMTTTTAMAPPPPTTPSSTSFSNPISSSTTLPLIRTGTALIRGHSHEVTTLSWSSQGKLVTASDDCFVRQWQPKADRARHLRQVGEFGGERHLAGWAEVGDRWDVDEW
ncbi:hypothetical protein CDD80_5909 [Ophiocordyceps camponoti-rufipedis]|uniref:Uncharacterized protein n=1 Tax=Ophiocordyceps camponoti-rufipedis TaxID=2004952 RepID=A0A2C5YLL2_9HYPO|nr:hypothetical protein CDD80_5909 [Ophiocordyceps camponoti-rufipedis]